jgi:hypothetical protein
MATTYKKKDRLHGHFSPVRKKMEVIGRESGQHYFEWRGGVVTDNDVNKAGILNFRNADLHVALANGYEMLVETATKGW